MSSAALLNPALESVELPEDLADQLTVCQNKLHKKYIVTRRPMCFVFIRFAVFFQALFGVLLFAGLRYYLDQRGYLKAHGIPLGFITPLAAGSLFFFSFMINGVLTDYKEAEKIPSTIATAIEEFDHCARICIQQAEEKSKDCDAGKALLLRAQVLNHAVSMLLFVKLAMGLSEKKDFVLLMKGTMHNIDAMNQSFVKMIGHNPTVGMTMNYPRTVRTVISRVRTIIDTDFWPVGHVFMWTTCVLNLVVLITINKESSIAEFTVLPGLVFIFLFAVLMMKDVEDPFVNNVSQEPMNELRDRFIIDLQTLTKDSAKLYKKIAEERI